MVLLIDTNIIIDYLTDREPFCKSSNKIMEMIFSKKHKGVLAVHSIPTLWYILRKKFTADERREFILSLIRVFDIAPLDKKAIISALNRPDFTDFEDCLQGESAVGSHAQCIITRNTKDFALSRVPVYTPEEFCSREAV
jgi:predicted nucleic acid-binding protein